MLLWEHHYNYGTTVIYREAWEGYVSFNKTEEIEQDSVNWHILLLSRERICENPLKNNMSLLTKQGNVRVYTMFTIDYKQMCIQMLKNIILL